jgi:hypothetical protein
MSNNLSQEEQQQLLHILQKMNISLMEH